MSVDDKSHYAVLNVPITASHEEIKRAYYELSRRVHPDKQFLATGSSTNQPNAQIEFHQLSLAWEVLGDPDQRRRYDQSLWSAQNRARGVVQDEVDLDDMEFDENLGVFMYQCRCSGHYAISEDDLELGREIAPCSDCSLKIRVLYEAAEGSEA
ncbi:hypothetical protein GGI07_003075 [Coemansia sp. Benny D115]|nr:hypothetical protein GGI07_003075 [Coemansia sp. Benny D115]